MLYDGGGLTVPSPCLGFVECLLHAVSAGFCDSILGLQLTGDLNMSLSEYAAVGATSFPALARLALMPSIVNGSAACFPITVSFSASPTLPTFVGSRRRHVVVKVRAGVACRVDRLISDTKARVLRELNFAIARSSRSRMYALEL